MQLTVRVSCRNGNEYAQNLINNKYFKIMKTLSKLNSFCNLHFVMRSATWNIYCFIRYLDKTPLYVTIGGMIGIGMFSLLMAFARYLEGV